MKTTALKLIQINQTNIAIFNNLGQAYEAEFSKLTQKLPDKNGVFAIDTLPHPPYLGYLLYYHEAPIGFCVINVENEINDFAEFYVIPVMRKQQMGYALAVGIFERHPGEWQARQIQGAVDAAKFCRSVIRKYTNNNYEEAIVKDAQWGTVTQQRFRTIE